MVIAAFAKPMEFVVNKLLSRHDRKEDQDQKVAEQKAAALKSLVAILTTTVGYVEGLPDRHNRDKEIELSNGWAHAMMNCRYFFDDDNVFWMWRKSMSWLNNEILTPDELKELQIDLPTVQKKVTEMVLGSEVKKHITKKKAPYES
jgi:hypothetical protein